MFIVYLCSNGFPYYNVSYYNYNSLWGYYEVIHKKGTITREIIAANIFDLATILE